MRTTGIAGLLLAAAGCAAPPASRGPTELEKLQATSDAYRSFHYKAELSDGTRAVMIELAWRAPDRAILRYGSSHVIFLSGGVEHRLERKTYTAVDTGAILEGLKKTYGDLLPFPPQISFMLGNWALPLQGHGLLARIDLRPLAHRLGWLEEVVSRPREVRLHQWGALEWDLRDDGFLQHVKIGGSAELRLVELSIDQPVDDAVFELPAHEGAVDLSEAQRRQRGEELDDAFHRWALEARPEAAVVESLVRADLARRVEPEKMIEIQRKNLEDDLEAVRKQKPDAPGSALRERTEISRGKTMGALGIIEEDLQKDFARRLDRYLSGRAPEALGELWRAAVARQVDLQLRRPLEQVFAEKLR
ncbi:MAG TPA: hypothetical protein VEN81_00715 [Planctomycetota bacterium]|nr:hypothetical protein [Planctomycetota bacterium]